MTIKQQGGIFGRNPDFNNVSVDTLSAETATFTGSLREVTVDTSKKTLGDL